MNTHPDAFKTILVVDDDVDAREGMRDVLESEGYRAVVVENGLQALRYLHSSPAPNLILLDLMMPQMDGWQFREEQRSDPSLRDIPVVVLSAYAGVKNGLDGLEACAIVRKPFRLNDFLSVVARCSAT